MPIFLDLLVVVIAILLFMVVITQLVIPVYTGEPFFPFFRKSAIRKEITKTEHELEGIAEQAHLKELKDKLDRLRSQLGEIE